MHVCPRISPNCKIGEIWALCDFCAQIAPDLRNLLQPRVHDVRFSGILCSKSGRTFGNCKRVKMRLNSLFWKIWPWRSEIGLPSRLACKSASPLASRVQNSSDIGLPSRLACKSVSPFASLMQNSSEIGYLRVSCVNRCLPSCLSCMVDG